MAKKHKSYEINGTPVPGVTTVLNVLAKPELDIWYGKVGLTKAEQIKNEAAEFGTKVHSVLEAICTGQKIAQRDDKLTTVANNFEAWADRNIKEWLAFEKAVYHDTEMYAGTADAWAILKTGERVLIDFKTSKKVRDEYYLQVCAYLCATRVESNAVDLRSIEGARILHLDHQTLHWECVTANSAHLFPVFQACLEIYRWRNV